MCIDSINSHCFVWDLFDPLSTSQFHSSTDGYKFKQWNHSLQLRLHINSTHYKTSVCLSLHLNTFVQDSLSVSVCLFHCSYNHCMLPALGVAIMSNHFQRQALKVSAPASINTTKHATCKCWQCVILVIMQELNMFHWARCGIRPVLFNLWFTFQTAHWNHSKW